MKLILRVTGSKALEVSVKEDDTFETLQQRLEQESGIHLTLRQLSLGRKDAADNLNVLQFFNANGTVERGKEPSPQATVQKAEVSSAKPSPVAVTNNNSRTEDVLDQECNLETQKEDEVSDEDEPCSELTEGTVMEPIVNIKEEPLFTPMDTSSTLPGQLCRLCALPAQDMTFIYGENGIKQELGPKINTWLPIRVSRRDLLPKQVCDDCVGQLHQCQRFSITVMRAEYLLKGLVKDGNFKLQQKSESDSVPCKSEPADGDVLNEETATAGSKPASYCCPLCYEGNMANVEESTIVEDTESEIDTDDSDEDSVTRFTRKIGDFLDTNSLDDYLSDEKSDLSDAGASVKEENTMVAEDKIATEADRVAEEQEDILSVKSEPEFHQCRICDEYLANSEESVFHSLQKHGYSEFYPCVQCDKIFRSSSDLTRHYTITHKCIPSKQSVDVLYSCYSCGGKFSTHEYLLSHRCNIISSCELTCKACELTFEDKERFDFHRQLHQRVVEASFTCELCKTEFDDEARYYIHMKEVHEDSLVAPKGLKQHVCDLCGRTYQNKSAYLIHMRRHKEQNKYNCDLCSKSFTDKQTLKEHFTSHMEVKPFQCHICGKHLNRHSRLKKHLLSHEVETVEPQKLYCCSNCSEVLPSQQLAVEHAQDSHGGTVEGQEIYFELNTYEKVFRCEYCERCFSSHDLLNIHRNGHEEPRSFACSVCKIEFSTYSRVQTHKVTHNNITSRCEEGDSKEEITVPKMFGCDECEKSYIHWTYLSVHRKLKHAEVKPRYKCKMCPAIFPNSWGVAYHRKTRHPEEEGGGALAKRKPFKCDVCSRRYVSEASLQNHHAVQHNGETVDGCGTSYQCEECGKVFSRKISLEAHMRSHRGEKPYVCKLCNKTFVHPSGLSSHIRRHKGDKPHACKFCGKTFLQRSDRTDHERKHTGERPFTCETCGKTFRTRAMWFEHGRIHRDERPFPCEFCGLAFRRSYALKNHRMIHTGERNFACKYCKRTFRIKQDLQKHERTQHQDSDTPMMQDGIIIECE